jgi:hypothetical protein
VEAKERDAMIETNKELIDRIREEFEGAITEIKANKTLRAKDEYNQGWNDASDNAAKFIQRYIDGDGLFQQ